MDKFNTTQPDQNNSFGKIKYFTNPRQFEQPLFRFFQDSVPIANSMIYGAGGFSSQDVEQSGTLQNGCTNSNTQYTRNMTDFNKTEKSNVVSGFDSKYFPQPLNTGGNPSDFAKKVSVESEFKIPQHSKINQIPEIKSTDGRTFKLIHDRRRNLDHSNYIPAGSKTNTGFGNIADFSKIKYGQSTRDIQGPTRDKEQDRFHFTHRNYQHEVYGSNPFPKDTRYLNKKF